MVSNEKWFGASAGFYPETINQSLRLEDGDSANLSKNFSASNRKTNTFSFWVKRGNLSSNQIPFSGGAGSSQNDYWFRFLSNNTLEFRNITSNSYNIQVNTSSVLRDTNWYHIVLAVDTTQATSTNRVKIYVNGEQQTLTFTTTPAQDSSLAVNYAGNLYIGRLSYSAQQYLDGYIAEFNFIDGTALDPTYFGETKNGVWIPKAISGLTYGTNGFRLTFADSSNLGDDTSGNGNDFAVNGLASTDVVLDSPTNNFCTLDPNFRAVTANTLSEGNLKSVTSTAGRSFNAGTFLMTSGKWYWEFKVDENSGGMGVAKTNGANGAGAYQSVTSSSTSTNTTDYYYGETNFIYYQHKIRHNGSVVTSLSGSEPSDLIYGVAVDMDASPPTITYYVDGSSVGSADLDTGFDYIPIAGDGSGGVSRTININFGQNPTFNGTETAGTNTDGNGNGLFHDAVPSNHLALCSSNLPDTTISPNQSTQADDHFNTVLYSGTGSSNAITGVGFQPDWSWFKERSSNTGGGDYHFLLDSSRGSTAVLQSNTTGAESTGDSLSFDSDGFTLGTYGGGNANQSGETYVAWNWRCGGSTPTKTYKVVVVSDSGNKYRFRNSADSATFAQSAVTLDLQEGGTYVFDWSDSSAQGHPIRFSTTSDGTHGGGSAYTTGVVNDDSNYKTTITVADSAPTLYYYCSNHSGMGGQINTNTTHGSTNFDGSLLSVVQSNETSGFSISKYTGTGSLATVGHGLGSTAQWVIIKKRSASGNWVIGHHQNGFDGQLYFDSGAFSSNSGSFNNTAPTSTVVTINTDSTINTSSATYVMYCFTEIEGYSKFGSYTGNGSTDGTFVFTGFRPAWILIKQTNSNGSWVIHDNKRSSFNVIDEDLFANLSSAESDNGVDKDFLSNGFKHRASHSAVNGSGSTYIYMAFAEQPFKFSNSR